MIKTKIKLIFSVVVMSFLIGCDSSNISSDANSDISTNISSDANVDVNTNVNSEVNSDISSDAGSDVNSDISSDAGSDVSSDISSDANGDVNTNVDSEVISDISSDVGSEASNNSEGASLQWYARTTVSAVIPDTQTVITHKTAGVFGQLNESDDGKDLHDIIGMGTQTATLEVVFPQNEWDTANGDYFSDYHSVKESGDSWTFQVKNMYNPEYPVDLSNEAITITLDGIYTVKSTVTNGNTRYSETLNSVDERLENLTLIDLDNGVAYAVSELQTAEITMNGMHTRTFKWVLGTVTESDYAPLVTPVTAKSMSRKNTAEAFKMSSETAPDSKFGLPPQ